jgi:DNA repair protein RadD
MVVEVEMIHLRPYQQKFAGEIRSEFAAGARGVLGVSPTGSGKTRVFCHITRCACEKQKRTLIVTHRGEILRQISDALRDEGVDHGVIRSGYPMRLHLPVQLASIQTLVKRMDTVIHPDMIIADEFHHVASSSYHQMLAKYSGAKLLGVTATPERLDGKGLGEYVDAMVRGPEVQWLIDNGFLAKPVYYAPVEVDLTGVHMRGGDYAKDQIAGIMDKPSIIGDAVTNYRKFANGKTAIAFCVNLKHARDTSDAFNAAGIKAEVIDGTMDDGQRMGIVARIREGSSKLLVSCELVGEGFDAPAVGAAILLRPTASLGLHLQQLGRCLRPKSDRSGAVIIDHVGNVVRHGLAEEVREWSLEGSAAKKRSREVALETRRCEKCYAVFTGLTCPQCGEVRESKVREIEIREGELQKLETEKLMEHRKQIIEHSKCRTFADFQKIEKQRGYKRGWAFHRWKSSKWNARARDGVAVETNETVGLL